MEEDIRLLYGDDLPDGILTDTHLNIPGLPAMPLDSDAWQDWAVQVLVHRERVRKDAAINPRNRKVYEALCKQPFGLGQIYFANTFGWIYEPRNDDVTARSPMILYPRQALLLLARDACMRRPKGQYSSMAIPKSRGVGASWMACLDQWWRWRFKTTFQGRFVSRVEDLVDGVGNSDSIFWKLDYISDNAPAWILPKGYSTQRGTSTRAHMKMVNPETGSAIIGEATTSGIGVGGRATCYDVDEAARIRSLQSVAGQLSETTNHRFFTSTHNIDISEDFWHMCHATGGWEASPVIFAMPWDCVPGRDEAWLIETRKTMTNEMFQREVMMNPHAGISTWVYPVAKTMSLTDRAWNPASGLGLTGMDDGYDDDFAIVWAQWDRASGKLIVLDSYQNSHKPISFYGSLLRGIPDNHYVWDQEALRLMAWIRRYQLWQNIHVGDRHGDNFDLTSGTSPWKKLQEEFGIPVLPSSHVNNDHKSRRDALSEALTRIEFASTPGAHAALEAIANNRFPAKKEGSEFAAEHRKPIHDQTSHLTTTMEYLAMYAMETFAGRIYGISSDAALKVSSNGWLARNEKLPDNGRYVRSRPEERGSGVHNGWIR